MPQPTSDLTKKKCKPCEGGAQPLSPSEIEAYLKKLQSWSYTNNAIEKTFSFKNYYETLSFVNAVAWIAHREDHHPDISFGYKTCTIRYSTHAVKGMTENDFICAAKIDELLR
jgi:4a-hydroxytetrahydrobiopterin dehydratase